MNTKRSFPAIIYILVLLFFITLFYVLFEIIDFKATPESTNSATYQTYSQPEKIINNGLDKGEVVENILVHEGNMSSVIFLPGVFALLAAFVALFGVSLTAFLTSQNNNKNIFINVVTRERAKWREELRRDVSEFYSLAYAYSESGEIENTIKLQELKVLIKLRLNPDSTHKLDKYIMYAVDSIAECITSEKKDKDISISEQLFILESNVQKLLKQEWEKSKMEAREGSVRNSI